MRKFVVILLLCFSFLFIHFTINADEYDDLQKQINDLKTSLDASKRATNANEQNLQGLNNQVQAIKNSIASLEKQIAQKEKEVKEGEEAFNYQKVLLDERTVAYYKNINKHSLSLINMLISDNLSDSLKAFFYEKQLADEDRQTITKIAAFIKNIKTKKAQLVTETARLSGAKAEVDKQAQFLAGEVSKSKAFEATLSSQIADLNAKQQQILASKQSAVVSSSGQSADTQSSSAACSPSTIGYPSTIRVKFGDGHVEAVDFEGQYLKSIGEMPEAWDNLEAFKSQAVAARTYAIFKIVRSTCRDFDVYSDTRDQVYTGNPKGGKWSDAVEQTRGQYLKNGDQAIIAYYSANAGGYTLSPNEAWGGGGGFPSSVNDISGDGKGNSDLNARCIGTLRWEYHYNIGREGHVQYNDTCGGDINNNNSPLTNGEVEDIVDATTWALHHGNVPDNSMSHDQIKSDIGGDAIGSIQSMSASFADNKYTNNLHVVGSNKTIDFSGDQAQTFRLVFNIRSPGQYLIMSTSYGAHYIKYDVLRASDAHGTQGDGWYFYTYGYGHRIGLDQEGALGMASQGKNYTDILSHYYQGTSLTSNGYSGEVK